MNWGHGSDDRGKEVVASAAGTVVTAGGSLGTVEIDHGGGWYTIYRHMSPIVVGVNQVVAAGQLIGYVSNVGATDVHLHYEQVQGAAAVRPIIDGVAATYTTTENSAYLGKSLNCVGVPEAKAQRFVIMAYRAALGREVDASGLSYWTDQLVTGARGYAEVFDWLTSSDEYRGNLLASSYRTYVGREIDSGAITYWKGQMAQGMTIETVQANLLGSPEVFGQAGGNNAVWVDQVYQRALRRPASPSDVAYWTGQLGAGMLRETVAKNILYSSEHLGYVIDDFYARCFGTVADPSGKDFWLKKIQAGATDERVFQQIFTTDMTRF